MPAPLTEYSIESWEALTRVLDHLQQTMSPPWFRGQRNHSWRLRPLINRYLTDVPAQLAARLELDAMVSFMGEAHEHLPATAMPRGPSASMCLTTMSSGSH